jgi:hypothetical protein
VLGTPTGAMTARFIHQGCVSIAVTGSTSGRS